MNKSRNATAPSGFIQIENNEKLIVSTNYWTSRYSQNGIYYFSVNAGCVRLLLPNKDTSGEKLDDTVLNATQYVIISRGTYRGGDGYEVLFEDGTAEPFVVFTGADQWDRAIPINESGRTDLAFHIYRNGQLIRQLACRFRAVPRLPYLKEWK